MFEKVYKKQRAARRYFFNIQDLGGRGAFFARLSQWREKRRTSDFFSVRPDDRLKKRYFWCVFSVSSCNYPQDQKHLTLHPEIQQHFVIKTCRIK